MEYHNQCTALHRIEMKRARLRALIHTVCIASDSVFANRNEESPFKGIDTYFSITIRSPPFLIEMKRARLRALIHCRFFLGLSGVYHRNEESPFKGIDTLLGLSGSGVLSDRNEESPFKGIDTPISCVRYGIWSAIEMKRARLRALIHPMKISYGGSNK